jgi:hypothetical protein
LQIILINQVIVFEEQAIFFIRFQGFHPLDFRDRVVSLFLCFWKHFTFPKVALIFLLTLSSLSIICFISFFFILCFGSNLFAISILNYFVEAMVVAVEGMVGS